MQHMNQALKERGELISKLQESISDNKGKIIKLTDENQEVHDQIQQVNNQLSLKEDVINNKDMLIKELENEIKKLKDMHETNTEGDVLSSSTINRTEEASRMKDIEESFEDKYVKLKFLAVKLKKRLSDTTHTLEVERIKNAAEKQELQEKIQTLSVAAATAQKVQATCDKVLDELEEEKRKYEETKTLLESSTKSEDNLKLQILNLESEVNKIPALQNQLESFEWSLKESKKEFKTLQTQKAEEVLKCEQLIKDKSELENKLCELNQSLQQALQQSRVNNVLELEMQNYEKTIGDLLSQLNSEKGLSKSQTKEIESLKNLVSGFEQQIKLLEGKLNVEEEKYQHLNEQLSGCHSKNNRLQALLDEQILKTDSLTKELQREKNKCETLVLECSNIGLEFKKQEKEFHLKLDALQTHAHNLENSLASAKQDLLASKNEVDHLKNEFDSYRIRAQSVLAKQKGDAITQGEKEAREQLEYMTIEMNVIRQRLDSTM
ncbi:hypothetical protein AAG570_000241 [Ranatra chinensis]|uniref:Uncharacterized protein n=1 Tax=Ranatra chinensis TaxID=642074 RepID=A0ABD0ZJS9_9HEMI